jgi:hypothetical protein
MAERTVCGPHVDPLADREWSIVGAGGEDYTQISKCGASGGRLLWPAIRKFNDCLAGEIQWEFSWRLVPVYCNLLLHPAKTGTPSSCSRQRGLCTILHVSRHPAYPLKTSRPEFRIPSGRTMQPTQPLTEQYLIHFRSFQTIDHGQSADLPCQPRRSGSGRPHE